MAKRKLPPRYKSGPKKGQFKPKSARRKTKRRRKNPSKAAARRRARRMPRDSSGRFKSTRRRRSNPATGVGGVGGFLLDGAVGAVTLTTGKVATRAVPGLVGQQRTSNVGLAIQLAAAVALGFVVDQVAGEDWGSWVLAGALAAPLEDAVQRYQVPWVSTQLAPGTVGLYAPPRGGRSGRVPANRRIHPGPGVSAGPGVVASWRTPHVNGSGVAF